MSAVVARELVTLIGFRINETQLASVEKRVSYIARMMTFALSVPITLFGKSILEASYKMDMLRLSIETYSTSTEEAARVTEELKKLATELPTVKVEDLSDTVGNLLARGIEAKDLVDTFKTFAVITGATGGNLKGLVKAYTDTMSKGKLAGQEFNQFINASVPLRKALSQALGKSSAEIIKMQKEGKITFEVVRDALKGLAADGSQFSEIMGKKANLLYGIWQKFQDIFFYFKAELGKKLEYPIKLVVIQVEKFVTLLRSLDGNWKRFFVIGMAVFAIIPPFVALYMVVSKMLGPIGIFLTIMTALSLIIDDIYVWVKGGKSIAGSLFGDFEQYRPTIENLINSLKSIKDLVIEIKTLFSDIATSLKEGFNLDITFPNVLITSLNAIADIVGTITGGLRLIVQLLNAITSLDSSKITNDAFNTFSKHLSQLAWGREKGLELFKKYAELPESQDTIRMIHQNKFIGVGDTSRFNPMNMKPNQQNSSAVTNNINVSIDAKNSSQSPEVLKKVVKDAVSDSLKKANKNAMFNFSDEVVLE